MVGKVIDFLIVNGIYLLPSILVAALVLSQSARAAAAFVLRMIARPLLLIAVIALVYDGTRTMAGGSDLVITSFGEHWQTLFPKGFENLKLFITRGIGPAAWDYGVLRVFMLPGWLVIGGLGLLLAWIGRKRQRVNIYVNT